MAASDAGAAPRRACGNSAYIAHYIGTQSPVSQHFFTHCLHRLVGRDQRRPRWVGTYNYEYSQSQRMLQPNY
ncbi:hypothetical protein SFRURICE_012828 [Spodoptera frugiperda]|nr:hypothetical protein SFRURICE_012828 [Spodoptera frugiperda]